MTAELRSIYSGPIRRALEGLQRKVDDQGGNPIPAPGTYARLVGVGSLLQPGPVIAAGVWGNVTNPINITTVAGRWYRISMYIRAVTMATSANVTARLSTNPGVNQGGALFGVVAGLYSAIAWSWMFSGDGAAHQFIGMLQGGNILTVYTDMDGYFICEDLGKVQAP